MCGLTGFLATTAAGDDVAAIASDMADRLRHRGPDDYGVWTDSDAGFALAHRRLAVLDLSPAGHQPMQSVNGRWVLAYNGEIYNHLALREKLQRQGAAPEWLGDSDTETLLALIEDRGIDKALPLLEGMFAFALWDRKHQVLHLARDRMGEKPLYYGWAGSSFVFASELKALTAHPDFRGRVCLQALELYFDYNYVPAPFCIWEGVYKLEPGCHLIVEQAAISAPPERPVRPGDRSEGLLMRRWWLLTDTVKQSALVPITDAKAAIDELEQTLGSAVERQMLSDVPLGGFLSGGVDSSLIVALMQQHAEHPVKSFTIGFDEQGFDEAPFAAAVAAHLGTAHHEIRVQPQDSLDVIPQLPEIYDEPFADSSQIPTFLVCRAARAQVTVALSGDGGDELFGGYNRYYWGPRAWNQQAWLPEPFRRTLGAALANLPVASVDSLASKAPGLKAAGSGARLQKLGSSLRYAENIDDFYFNLVASAGGKEMLLVEPSLSAGKEKQAPIPLFDPLPERGLAAPEQRMMFRDSMSYLPDDILCKVDRAAMAVSLETRMPFLDRSVIELAWRLPLDMKVREGKGKWIARQVLDRHVPRALIERPKAGFAIPLGQWLRGPLREWAESLLDEGLLKRQGYLDPDLVRSRWQQHTSGRYDWTPVLWAVLMFQAWLAMYTEP